MATIVVGLIGQVRTIRDLRRRADENGKQGDVFGQEVSVLTELGSHLGETARVTVFSGPDAPAVAPGELVEWIVTASSSERYGLQFQYQGELASVAPVGAAA